MELPIHLNDYRRILIGEVPLSFFIEILLRASFVYLLLLVSFKAMGKRMSSLLSRVEFASLVALAAAIGVPMLAPDKGLLPSIVSAAVIVSVQRLIARRGVRSESFEHFSQGQTSSLVKDCVLDMKQMKKDGISRSQLFQNLRAQEILHLGEVKRAYIEAGGAFTSIKNTETRPGLSVIPLMDQELLNEQKKSDEIVCRTCGWLVIGNKPDTCPNCGMHTFEQAVS